MSEDNLNNSCKIYCDDDPNTDCNDIKLYSTNGYCKDVALLCIGTACSFSSSKIYCGYDQTQIVNLLKLDQMGHMNVIILFDLILLYGKIMSYDNGGTNSNSTAFEATCDELLTIHPTEDPSITISSTTLLTPRRSYKKPN